MNKDTLNCDEQPVLIAQSSRIFHFPHASNPKDSVCSTDADFKDDGKVLADVEDHMRACIHCETVADEIPRLVDLVFE